MWAWAPLITASRPPSLSSLCACLQTVESEFPTLRASKEEADNVGRRPSLAALRVTDYGTESGRQAADEAAAKAAREEKRRDIDRRCGAAHVLQAVIDARVPVVGHNCLSCVNRLRSALCPA